ncbi:SAM-dependent chlorinase/fluorinase [Pseudonocardia eucalypti]|uniref:SAM-dependent chlorinase/fluorinase n=1 Tax=Pseudonocardia eucalypti TaxID=648755 RepID=A0ABP9Q2P0_9PSEU|nr:S-adenosylmethionine hydrolase [Pseudonocardia eucalypti]
MNAPPWVTVTTDYGTRDGFVAAVHGVIARIAAAARVLDVTHEIPPGDVRWASVVLADTAPYLPVGVHVAVVDPGVGTSRRAVAVVAPAGVLIGPDNGLLIEPAEALGGVVAAYELADPAYRLPTVSRTFHGRDIFAPAAAHLANGVDPRRLGPELDPVGLVRLPEPVSAVSAGRVRAEVLGADRFGNLTLSARARDLAAAGLATGASATLSWLSGEGDQTAEAVVAATFADAGAGGLVVLPDSAGRVAVARRDGSAVELLGVGRGVELTIAAGGRGHKRSSRSSEGPVEQRGAGSTPG